jgi:hypothetical protein
MPSGNASDAGLSTQEEMRRSLRKILDKIGVEISDRFSHLPVNQLDLQNHEQFTELRNKCTRLEQQYSKDLNGLELHQDYRDIIIPLKRPKQNGGNWTFLQRDCSHTFHQ